MPTQTLDHFERFVNPQCLKPETEMLNLTTDSYTFLLT